jgi:excisionase family DNA binding protein
MTLKEVALFLKVAEKTVYRLVQDGKIPAFKVGGSWRFKRAELDTWIQSQTYTTAENDQNELSSR